MLVCWLSPLMGVLKLNFDASITPYDCAAAFIVLDHFGRLDRAAGKKMPPSTIFCAELVVTWMGCKVVIQELQVFELWMEGDSSIVIKWLKYSNLSTTLTHLLLQNLFS